MEKASKELLREFVNSQHFRSTTDILNSMKELFSDVLQQVMEAELEETLGYEKSGHASDNIEPGKSKNYRNGYSKKTVKTQLGEVDVKIPRDRNGEYEPKIIGKYNRNADGMEEKILALYACGMSQRDISEQIKNLYDVDISDGLVSKIVEKVTPEVNAWQNRPLESIYPIVFFDGIVFNSRKDNRIVSKCVYSVLGINMDGQKEILGTWISENESASFYASICSDLKNRGVTDIFIACHDNLTGLCTAINSIFPKTKNQLCIVHQIRNSCKFVPYKDIKAVCADLKKIYGAVNLEDAEYAKEEFREKWDKKYPNILKSWDKNWAELTVFFEYPQEIRKIIYTTNAEESYHRMVRKFTKSKAVFPTDDSIRKVIYMSVMEISKKWTMPVRDWGLAYAQLSVYFEDRFAA